MANLDPNTWYQIYNNDSGPGYGMKAGYPNPPPYGAIFLATFSQNVTNFEWQLIHAPGQSNAYFLRSNYLGPDYFVGATLQTGSNCGPSGCETGISMVPTNLTDSSAQWTFTPLPDGTFSMWNAANGSNFWVDILSDRVLLWLDADISDDRPGEHWSFSSIAAINNTAFSTIPTLSATSSLPATTTASMSSPSIITTASSLPSPAPASSTTIPSVTSPANNGSGGLSAGDSAAIGATIGAVTVGVIALVLFILFRRRKRRNLPTANSNATSGDKGYHGAAQSIPELPTEQRWELPTGDKSVELPTGKQSVELPTGK